MESKTHFVLRIPNLFQDSYLKENEVFTTQDEGFLRILFEGNSSKLDCDMVYSCADSNVESHIRDGVLKSENSVAGTVELALLLTEILVNSIKV